MWGGDGGKTNDLIKHALLLGEKNTIFSPSLWLPFPLQGWERGARGAGAGKVGRGGAAAFGCAAGQGEPPSREGEVRGRRQAEDKPPPRAATLQGGAGRRLSLAPAMHWSFGCERP